MSDNTDTESIWVHEPDEFSDHWTISAELRSSDWDNANYDAQKDLEAKFPSIEFDPEFSCFFAYAKTAADATALVEALRVWLVARGVVPS